MQQEAARKLSFTTKRTMMVAQQLYEGVELGPKGAVGLISYIRTDSVRVANEAQQAALSHIAERFGAAYVPPKPNVYRGRASAQDAHEAIRPTDIKNVPSAIREYLSNDQYKLYKLIYERFLASQMADARLAVSAVTFDVNGCTFKANGSRVLFDGFTAVYTEGRDEAQEKEIALPAMEQGDQFCTGQGGERAAVYPAAAALYRGDAGQDPGGKGDRPAEHLCAHHFPHH